MIIFYISNFANDEERKREEIERVELTTHTLRRYDVISEYITTVLYTSSDPIM